MREMLIGAARTYYMGMINKHIANMEVLLTNPVGIGEHPQHIEECDKLITKICDAEHKINI